MCSTVFGTCRQGLESRRLSRLTAITVTCCDDVGVLRRDDHVLVSTRVLALVIIPFLLGAFVILYGFPRHTARLFAWPIKPTMTSMMLASAYLGGAYFFVRVVTERHWNAIKSGFLPVVLFASLLGVATVMHWGVFNHQHVTFWIWATLYFATPFLVFGAWLANRSVAGVPAHDELRLSPLARWVLGAVGSLALIRGLVMFVAPGLVAPSWPWSVTALSCRVIGAIFCLGGAGLVVFTDPRWSTIKLLLQVEMIMVTLILVAAFRALPEFDPHNALTWLLGGGFVAILAGSVYLLVVMNSRARSRSIPHQPARTEDPTSDVSRARE
jgi:hypothetical protein